MRKVHRICKENSSQSLTLWSESPTSPLRYPTRIKARILLYQRAWVQLESKVFVLEHEAQEHSAHWLGSHALLVTGSFSLSLWLGLRPRFDRCDYNLWFAFPSTAHTNFMTVNTSFSLRVHHLKRRSNGDKMIRFFLA